MYIVDCYLNFELKQIFVYFLAANQTTEIYC